MTKEAVDCSTATWKGREGGGRELSLSVSHKRMVEVGPCEVDDNNEMAR